MEQENLIEKAKEMLNKADNGSNDCKQYNDGFIDGLIYGIKALRQPIVSCSFNHETISKIRNSQSDAEARRIIANHVKNYR